MSQQTGKEIRLSKVIEPDAVSLIVNADRGLALGPTAGLVEMRSGLESIAEAGVEAITLSPGEAARNTEIFRGKRAPALLVRSDWTNFERDSSFPLPRKETTHVLVAEADHAAYLGACGLVATFFVGYRDDRDEADNLESISRLAAGCFQFGMPLLAEAKPFGERVSERNYVDSLKMAARMALEAGSDAVICPYPGDASSVGDIIEASGGAPVLLLVEDVDGKVIADCIDSGISGLVLSGAAVGEGAASAIGEVRQIMEGCT
jgi:DhnA family fructose-bisphosphate aldolase class Ia